VDSGERKKEGGERTELFSKRGNPIQEGRGGAVHLVVVEGGGTFDGGRGRKGGLGRGGRGLVIRALLR